MWMIQLLFEKFLSMNEILCTIDKDLEGFLWNMRIVLFSGRMLLLYWLFFKTYMEYWKNPYNLE